MPDGDYRRPPLLWEQKLAQLVSRTSVGVVSGGGTETNTPDPPPGDGGPGIDPEPVTPAPVDFVTPSTPTLTGAVQGIRVRWDGLNSSGNLWPYTTSWVEVHMSTTSATFTPDATTLIGRLDYPGEHFAGGLTAGTTYHFRLRGADAAGNFTDASTAASGQTGLTTSNDYGTGTITSGAVSFNARQIGGITTTVGTTAPTSPVSGDVWLDSSGPGGAITHKRWDGSTWVTQAWGSASLSANSITAVQIAAGAVTAGAILAGEVTAEKISGDAIDGKTITGATVRTSAGTGARVVLDSSGLRAFNASNQERVNISSSTGNLTVTGGTITGATLQTSGGGNQIVIRDDAVAGGVDAIEFKSNNTTVANLYGDSTGLVCTGQLNVLDDIDTNNNVNVGNTLAANSIANLGFSGANRALRVDATGAVFSYGIDGATTGSAANVRVEQTGARQLVRSTSTERVKADIVGIGGSLEGVNPNKISAEGANVDPWDVLNITPAEFRSLAPVDENQRMFGFIAENVATVFPFAAEWDEDGIPSSVSDRPILAALLAVVKDQQQRITDLTARLDALEA